MYSDSVEKLIKLFAKFPTIGARTALRFVFYLTKKSPQEISEITQAIQNLQQNIKICALCGKTFEGSNQLCQICSDPRRDKTTLCIVEKEIDLEAMEKTRAFKGLYFILGSNLLKFKNKEEPLEKRITTLVKRVQNDNIQEIILALNPTPEGQNTALWVKRQLEPLQTKTTQLGRGLPTGGELEYADEETLSSAFENRK